MDIDTGTDVAPGCEGELLIRGPQVMLGYLDQPEAMADAFEDGWFRTGDLARQDADGQVVIVDRIKDLIKFRGAPISPGEIEQVLLRHPAVREAAVVAMPSGADGECPRAFVVPAPGASILPVQLIAHVAQQLAAHKVPDSIELVEALPRNSAGKILRRELAYRARQASDLSWSDLLKGI
jgi:acyl-CoA synthetase (AMP-forming)/AMP-acid ligase II